MKPAFLNYFKVSFISLTLLILLSGCATEQSSIIKGTKRGATSTDFSSGKYLKATGIGNSEKEARLNAKAELAAIFESKVSSDVINRVRSIVEGSGKETVTRDDERNIKVLSSVDLKGVEINKTWYDEKQRAYYAVAMLERAKAGDDWQKEVDHIDDEIELILGALNRQKSDFSKFQSLKKARQLWMNKEVILSRLRVLGYSDLSVAAYNARDIFSSIQQLKSQFMVFITVGGASNRFSEVIVNEISEGLSNAGYLITNDKEEGNLLIEASLKVMPVELNNPGWEFARAALNLSIVDKASGLTVGEISENKRSSHLTYEEAAHKAVKTVSKISTEKVIEYFGASN